MNNEEFVNKKVQKVVDIYENIETELLLKIVEHFKYKEEFLNSDHWRVKKLEEMGLFNKEVIDYIAKATKKTPEKIKKALKDIGYESFNLDMLNQAFEDGKLKIDPNILIQNNTLNTIINNVYDEVTEKFINMSPKIAQATRNAYLDIVEKIYFKTTMGTHSYQEAIREVINKLSNNGIKTLTYKTIDKDNNTIGIRSYDIEATARREILTGARQVNLKLNETIIEELEPEYLYLSEHLRCRPTHFDWQGTIIKKEDLIPVTNYGDVAGLGGVNCAHYFEPYFGSARGDELKSISKEEALKNYNVSQQQRYLERGVRKWKRKAEMFKESGDIETYKKSQAKVKKWQQRNIEFSEENKVKRDFTREYVNINDKLFRDNPIIEDFKNLSKDVEHLIVYDINMDNKLLQVSSRENNSVGGAKAFKILLTSKSNTLMAVHNHPSNSSFSFKDIETFNNFKSLNTIVVKTDKYLYYLEKNDISKIKEKELKELYNKTLSIYMKKYDKKTCIHYTNLYISEKVGWRYGRKKYRL